MMDECSRMILATIVKSKDPGEIGAKILKNWCLKGMGYPSKYFFYDNGKEFQGRIIDIFAKKNLELK